MFQNKNRMEAIEFNTTLQSNGNILLPAQYAKSIDKDAKLHVIILLENTGSKTGDWQKEAINNFFKDETDADDVYNKA